MSFLVDTNVVASQPSERRPAGTLNARAKMDISFSASTQEIEESSEE